MLDKFDKIMPYAFPVVVVLLLVFFYNVNPSAEKYPIKCMWHLFTGTQCAGCGFQRAIFALMHGEFVEALRYNYFFVIAMPYIFLVVLVSWYNFNHVFDGLRDVVLGRRALMAYLVLYVGWWILRNILGV